MKKEGIFDEVDCRHVRYLEGAELDYWAGMADGISEELLSIQKVQRSDIEICAYAGVKRYAPSLYWEQGGKIVDKKRIAFDDLTEFNGPNLIRAYIKSPIGNVFADGETHLIAAMRALILDVYGETVPPRKEILNKPETVND